MFSILMFLYVAAMETVFNARSMLEDFWIAIEFDIRVCNVSFGGPWLKNKHVEPGIKFDIN